MLGSIHSLLDEADVIITYNGKRFDTPVLQKDFLEIGLPPPSPYKHIDLLQTARRQFRFHSNKLDYVAKQLGVGRKTEHSGAQLWLDCMEGDRKAWKLMEKYNKNDVLLLESVYEKLRPWIKNHPNSNVYSPTRSAVRCPTCGGNHLQSRGIAVTQTGRYRRYNCTDCGSWSRDRLANEVGRKEQILVTST